MVDSRLPDLDEIDPGDVETPDRRKAKRKAEVCGRCGEEIGEPVFFVSIRVDRPFGRNSRWRVPACESCGREKNHVVRLEARTETDDRFPEGSPRYTRHLEPTHTEATCAGCGRTCILDRDRQKHSASWIKCEDGIERMTFCSQKCRVRHHNRKRSERLKEKREGTKCRQCGDTFTPDRSDAKYCSAACKQRAYRQRKKG